MRRKYLFILLAGVVALVACHRTLSQLPGIWQGQRPVDLDAAGAYHATATISMQFSDPGTTDSSTGDVTLTALLDVQDVTIPIEDADGMVNYAMNIAGTASISGTWTQHDDDEVYLELDARTLKVNIDPDGVTYNTAANGDGAQDPRVIQLLPTVAATVAGQLTPAVKAEFYRFTKIDDINIRDRLLTCEVADKDYTFRQTNP